MEPQKTSNNHAGKQGKKPDDKDSNIAWHPAFLEAIQLELEDYKDVLEFIPEFQLTKEPMRIDCVIIKKAPNVVIKKNIAAIFREINLLEYKSPDDYVSVAGFYKAYAYACLYAYIKKVPMDRLTVSFIESRYPEKLIEHLINRRRYVVEENSHGIYTVKGDILPIQIIDSRQLPASENLWLKDLRDKLAPQEIQQILAEISKQGKEAGTGAYLDVITRANNDYLEEAINMSRNTLSFAEMLEKVGITAEIEARGEERKAIKVAQNMVNLGLPPETVIAATQLDPEKVKTMYQSIEQ